MLFAHRYAGDPPMIVRFDSQADRCADGETVGLAQNRVECGRDAGRLDPISFV